MQTRVPEDGTKEKSLTSRVIDFVRFPLIVLVVTIHVQVKEFAFGGTLENFPVADVFCDITKDGISRIAVPLFFFISGYLFFLNVSSFSREVYFKKLKSRFWTLFLPMVIWGVAFFLAEFLSRKLAPGLFQRPQAFDYSSILELVHNILRRGILAGDLGPFWFIHGLIIACILSPLWFLLLKKLKVLPLIIFGLWFCFFSPGYGTVPAYDFGAIVVFFFCFGAYFSIHGIDFTKVFSKIRIPVFIVYSILLVGDAVLHLLGYAELCDRVKCFEVIIGLVAAIALVSGFLEKRQTLSVPKTLRDATFFVYAGHVIVLWHFVPKIVSSFPSLFEYETSFSIILAFIVGTVVATGVFVLVSILVRKFAPWSIKFLTGGR